MVKKQLDAEEREILEHFERGEVTTAPGAEREIATAPQAARNTLSKSGRAGVIHKHLSGRLTEKK